MDVRARAILLDQYESGVHTVDNALKRVVAELGLNSIDEQEAVYWWQRFQASNWDINNDACEADCVLLKNGKFLRASRGLFQLDNLARFHTSCNTSGVDDRFYITYSNSLNFVVDTFYGIKRKIVFDCSAISTNGKTEKRFRLFFLHFLSGNRVLGSGYDSDGLQVFCGTFDFNSCVLQLQKAIPLNGQWDEHYLMLNLTTQQPSILLAPTSLNRMYYAAINMTDGDLSLDGFIEVPTTINFPMIMNDKIFGFSNNVLVNTQQVIMFCLTSRTKTVYNIKTDCLRVGSLSKNSPYTWNAKKLRVARYNWESLTTKLIEFDLQDLKWQETTIEVKGKPQSILLVNNSLILHSYKREEDDTYTRMCYRFPFGSCDSLSSAVWDSIRHYSQVHPEFNRWIASKLPNSLRHYSPLWD